MTILTKHLANARKYKKLKRNDTLASLKMEKITLSNDMASFSINVFSTLSFAAGSPLNQLTNNLSLGIIYTKLIITQDADLRSQLIDHTSNLNNFLKIVETNSHKLQQIDIPFNAKAAIRKKDSLDYGEEITFSPLTFKEKSTPDNLYIFGVAIAENISASEHRALTRVQRQDLIIGQRVVPAQNVLDIRQSNFDSYLDFNIINQVTDTPDAYFSDQFTSLDTEGYIKFVFFWDKIQFLKEKSLFGNILKNGSLDISRKKMINDSRISDIKILRKRVKKNIDGFSSFDTNEINEVVIYSSDDVDSDLIDNTRIDRKTGKTSARISSPVSIKNASEYITFAVDDYYSQKVKMGLYQYSVQVKVEDGMLKFLLDSLQILREGQQVLLEKRNAPENASPSLNDACVTVISNILRILFSLRSYSAPEMGKIQQEFRSLAAFVDGLERIISFNDSLMTKISYALGDRGVIIGKNKGTVYGKNTSNLFFLEDVQKFADIVSLSELNNPKKEYLNIAADDSVGVTSFSELRLKDRFFNEFKKNFNFEGSIDELNFADINEQMALSNSTNNSAADISKDLFDLQSTFFSYLSPSVLDVDGATIKNTQVDPSYYNPSQPKSLLSISEKMAALGVRILPPVDRKSQDSTPEIEKCSENIFGTNSNINLERTYSGQSDIPSVPPVERFCENIKKSNSLINGITKHYNNFNLQRSDYDLSSPNNLIDKKVTQESQEMIASQVAEMPNQIRALFGSKSDLVKNKWSLMSNDFLANPDSTKMMKENYSNLIRVEVLSGFAKDSDGQPNTKSPIFKRLEMSDFQELSGGESLFCRTYVMDDRSLGIGQTEIFDNPQEAYYNKHFIITKGSE
jgi:hypothetical protein